MAHITEWRLGHFKSRRDQVKLEFKPLTVFCGANNSGKSTVIQSILLLKQTLASEELDRVLVLNGPFLRMGTFNDVVHGGDPNKRIELGFSVSSAFSPVKTPEGRRPQGSSSPIKCDVVFTARPRVEGGPSENYQLAPALGQFSMLGGEGSDKDTEGRLSDPRMVEFNRSGHSVEERARNLGLTQFVEETETEPHLLRYSPKKTTEWIRRRIDRKYSRLRQSYEVLRAKGLMPSSEIKGVTTRHFLPEELVFRVNLLEMIERLVKMLTSPEFLSFETRDSHDNFDTVSVVGFVSEQVIGTDIGEVGDLAEFVTTKITRYQEQCASAGVRGFSAENMQNFNKLKDHFGFREWLIFWMKLGDQDKKAIHAIIQAEESQLSEIIRNGLRFQHAVFSDRLPRDLIVDIGLVRKLFNGLSYLGPLREDPRPIYPLATGTSHSQNVGIRGENTAAVLNANRTKVLTYIPSGSMLLSLTTGATPDEKRVPLRDAVLDWLAYLDIVSDVHSEDMGKIGHGLQVTSTGDTRLVDLTHVGVGVSQVLPIVVQALLAPKNTVLIFEQPELHLHPRVQTRIGDFFLSMTYLGKQCIIETHSEHLITRLRQRSAGAPGNEVAESIMIYFVEKEDGQSEYRPVQINQYGVIEDWPAGFFDEGADQAAELLRLGMDKRMKGG